MRVDVLPDSPAMASDPSPLEVTLDYSRVGVIVEKYLEIPVFRESRRANVVNVRKALGMLIWF